MMFKFIMLSLGLLKKKKKTKVEGFCELAY